METCEKCGRLETASNVYSLGGVPIDPDQTITSTGDLEDEAVVGVLCQQCWESIGTRVP